ncbi:glycosyltransferase family 39 protein [Candidatus Saccharibacteria bacterium]|nr:glycosyltransferase family 39 protein [Candidatus Saccharibacteria bacterium]
MAKKLSEKLSFRHQTNNVLNFIEGNWWAWVILAVVVTYVVIMLLARGQSIWFDEGYSIMIAQKPIDQLLALTAVDAHPPFYYLLLKAWAGVFGWSEFALRSLSAGAAAITVGVALLLIRRLFTTRVALVVLPFLIVSPFFLRYGYEIRMYAVVGLIGVLATWVLVRAVESGRTRWWVGYAVLVALGMYTLYMSVVIWLAHFVWLTVRTFQHKQSLIQQKWFIAYIGAVALFVPYLPIFADQTFNSALPGIGGPLTIEKLSGILGLMISYTPSWQIGGVLSLGLLTVIGLGIYLAVFVWKQSAAGQRQNLQLMFYCVGVPLVFYILVSLLPRPFFIDRYMAHVAVFIYALLGIILALGWRHGKRIIATLFGGLVIILLSFGVLRLQDTGNFNFERMQLPMTTELRQSISCTDNTVIVADDPYTYIDSHYYFAECDLRFYSKQPVANRGGYALLGDSSARLASSNGLAASSLIHLRWDSKPALFQPDGRYSLVQSLTYDNQVVDRYERVTSAE